MKIGGIANAKMTEGAKSPKDNIATMRKKLVPRKIKIRNAILYTLGGIVLLVALLFAWYAKDLPTPANLAKLHATESTKIMDRSGNVLYQTGEERRTVINKDQIPQVMKNATLAAEDSGFYNHGALDYKGLARAAFSDVLHLKKSQGGSTITQQFVKNSLLTGQKSFSRKIKELILSKPVIDVQLAPAENAVLMTLTTDKLAKNVYLAIDTIDGFLTDNYFDLIPGKPMVIKFNCSTPLDLNHFQAELKVISLVDSY